jgi:hypothetical protein
MPEWARGIVIRSGVRANPDELGIGRDDFVGALLNLHEYAAQEGLDYSIVNAGSIDEATALRLWDVVRSLPRQAALG